MPRKIASVKNANPSSEERHADDRTGELHEPGPQEPSSNESTVPTRRRPGQDGGALGPPLGEIEIENRVPVTCQRRSASTIMSGNRNPDDGEHDVKRERDRHLERGARRSGMAVKIAIDLRLPVLDRRLFANSRTSPEVTFADPACRGDDASAGKSDPEPEEALSGTAGKDASAARPRVRPAGHDERFDGEQSRLVSSGRRCTAGRSVGRLSRPSRFAGDMA